MARPLRIQYPGAYYHVMNRGNRREDIFATDTDRSRFVDVLVDSCETFSVKRIAYVLMDNHFHFEEVIHQSILGTQSFVDWVKNKLPRQEQREIPSLRKLQHDTPAENIVEEVARAGQVQAEDLLDRKTGFKELRQMAMELSYRCSNEKQAEIGALFGVDYSTVSQNRARLKVKLKSSRKLNKQFRKIKEQVDNLSNTKI